jgi:hypothetical protein
VGTEPKAAVIAGPSQEVGAGPVRGFPDRGFRVIADARPIPPDAPLPGRGALG